MTTDKSIRVAIIGCGLIGTEWDHTSRAYSPPLTHARAFSQHPRAQLVALCDNDEVRVRNAAQHWRVSHAYTNPQQLFAEQNVDIAVIATPSAVRFTVIEPALAAGVKLLVIEKPLSIKLQESRQIVAAVNAAGVRALVNYSRNWDPSMRELKDRILAGAMGKVQRIVATYGKGISNNGSHLIHLTGFLCGANPMRARSLGSPLDVEEANWSPMGERAWDAQVEYIDSSGAVINLTLLGTDQRAFTCFELRVIGQTAMLELSMGGRCVNWVKLREDPNFAGYTVPAPGVSMQARYLEAMQEMTNEAVRIAAGEINMSSCDVNIALQTALVVDAIECSANGDGKWITLGMLR